MGETYSTPEVMIQTGASFMQLQRWAARGWLPDVDGNPGSGNRREWSKAMVDKAKWIVVASNISRNLPALADFVRRAAEAGVKP
jgi:hypothetical protein